MEKGKAQITILTLVISREQNNSLVILVISHISQCGFGLVVCFRGFQIPRGQLCPPPNKSVACTVLRKV